MTTHYKWRTSSISLLRNDHADTSSYLTSTELMSAASTLHGMHGSTMNLPGLENPQMQSGVLRKEMQPGVLLRRSSLESSHV